MVPSLPELRIDVTSGLDDHRADRAGVRRPVIRSRVGGEIPQPHLARSAVAGDQRGAVGRADRHRSCLRRRRSRAAAPAAGRGSTAASSTGRQRRADGPDRSKARLRTRPLSLAIVRSRSPSRLHRLIRPSAPPLAIVRPSDVNAMLATCERVAGACHRNFCRRTSMADSVPLSAPVTTIVPSGFRTDVQMRIDEAGEVGDRAAGRERPDLDLVLGPSSRRSRRRRQSRCR